MKFDPTMEALLAQMTLAEKVGQMTQVTIDLILTDDDYQTIDLAKLRKALVEKHTGSILNVKQQAYSLKKWHEIQTTVQQVATRETRLGIPVLYGIDAIHGANYIEGGTLFPHNIGMAASRNADMVEKGARITAMETRASGIRWNFDPVFGLGRQPLWSRFEETFGEDSFLAGYLGVAAVKGYEQDDLRQPTAVAACMKHYIAYSVPRSGKDRTPAYLSDVELREFFLPPFERAVAAGVQTAMINSADINGMPVHGSRYYLTDILREELGFEGVIVSDWEDVIRLHTWHRIADSPKEAVRLAVEAGLDLSMVPFDYSFFDLLLELVEEGTISEARIDESVRRILILKERLGLFEHPFVEDEAIAQFGDPSYAEKALDAARQTMTLLKNERNILPLPKKANILLAGPAADSLAPLHGSWSFIWQGTEESVYPTATKTIRVAFEGALGAEYVRCLAGKDFEAEKNYAVESLQAETANCDYIILCLGENAYAESPGWTNDLSLDRRQLELVRAAAATGKPIIGVFTQGRPRIIAEVEPLFSAILLAYRPGSQGAQAIVETLRGEHNPFGRLPYTYPQATGDILPYDHKYADAIEELEPGQFTTGGYHPQWPFGFGLSYTSFQYDNLRLSQDVFTADEQLTLSVDVTNTGGWAGHHSVEWYSRDHFASLAPSVRRLRGVDVIHLAPGERQTVQFQFSAADLAFINAEGKRVTEVGQFDIMVGSHTKRITFWD